jgi:predicted alpha/beta hydrolase family esterase
VLLVAPPSPRTTIPEIASFFPPPMDVDTVRRGADGTVLVAGDDDPYLPEGIAAAYGLPLRIATTVVPGGGHLNVDAGFGEWPAVADWCGRDNLAFY